MKDEKVLHIVLGLMIVIFIIVINGIANMIGGM